MCVGSGGLLFFCSVSPRIRRNRTNRFRSWGVNCCSRWGSFCSRFILLFCFLWFQKNQKKQRTGYLFCSWWCVVACEFYSAVLILTVPEQSEESSRGLVCVYHFAKEVAVGGFFCGSFILLFCFPPFRTIRRNPFTHTRFVLLYRYIRSGVAFLLERFILLLCFPPFRTIRRNGLLGCSIS